MVCWTTEVSWQGLPIFQQDVICMNTRGFGQMAEVG